MIFEQVLLHEQDTLARAQQVGELLQCRGIVYLIGPLGAGKTTFARGILRAYGYAGAVKSPTFTLVEPYTLPCGQVYHFDLYRLADPEELAYLGVDDYFSANELKIAKLCLIEWPERGGKYLPTADLIVQLSGIEQRRELLLQGRSEWGNNICQWLTNSS